MDKHEQLKQLLNDKQLDLVVTVERLKQSAIDKGMLRLVDYGVSDEWGETVFIGTIDEMIEYVSKKPQP